MNRPTGRRPTNRQPRRGGSSSNDQSQPSRNSTPRSSHSTPRSNIRSHSQSYTSVPPYASLHPGTPVSIVLKQDQPTGHQVSGIVSELLTRGDHPRGVKVRLRDGRVGRVQRLVSEDEGVRGEEGSGASSEMSLGRNGEPLSGTGFGFASNRGESGRGRARGGPTGRSGPISFRHTEDVREDGYLYDERNPPTRSLGAYFSGFEALEAADKEAEKEKLEREQFVVRVSCPVCHVFEGDEVAVARHVEEHFG